MEILASREESIFTKLLTLKRAVQRYGSDDYRECTDNIVDGFKHRFPLGGKPVDRKRKEISVSRHGKYDSQTL